MDDRLTKREWAFVIIGGLIFAVVTMAFFIVYILPEIIWMLAK